ncbi:hypothetical protein BDN72DRAFT_902397 [Pluteus cervinus]|uniref:Uncharacterized protein n=1 Tax=Pluteus cervinus TaxID=181527 RepID=A0ACD3AF17_9AGAR|nr:hypothetical protein BDN72DRAFT_902397 [Pluteus cervinus]
MKQGDESKAMRYIQQCIKSVSTSQNVDYRRLEANKSPKVDFNSSRCLKRNTFATPFFTGRSTNFSAFIDCEGVFNPSLISMPADYTRRFLMAIPVEADNASEICAVACGDPVSRLIPLYFCQHIFGFELDLSTVPATSSQPEVFINHPQLLDGFNTSLWFLYKSDFGNEGLDVMGQYNDRMKSYPSCISVRSLDPFYQSSSSAAVIGLPHVDLVSLHHCMSIASTYNAPGIS